MTDRVIESILFLDMKFFERLKQIQLASENVNAGTWTKLSASFEAPTEQMRKASNAKIRIMRDAELRNAIADFEQRKVKLQETEEKADIVVSRLSYGVLIIENDL